MPGSTANWLSVKNSRYKTEDIRVRTIVYRLYFIAFFFTTLHLDKLQKEVV